MGEFRGERDGKGERGEGQKKGSKSKRKKKENITRANLPTQKKLENRKQNVDTRG
jgi:hypothetical protein